MTDSAASMRPLFAALGRIPSGVFVLTARVNGLDRVMLASWVQQCSFEPPQVSVALKGDRPFLESLDVGALFAVNILAEGQKPFLARFGKPPVDEAAPLDGLAVERPAAAAPVLSEALAHLQCAVRSRFPAGDHHLIVAQVTTGRLHQAETAPMIHVRKNGSHY